MRLSFFRFTGFLILTFVVSVQVEFEMGKRNFSAKVVTLHLSANQSVQVTGPVLGTWEGTHHPTIIDIKKANFVETKGADHIFRAESGAKFSISTVSPTLANIQAQVQA